MPKAYASRNSAYNLTCMNIPLTTTSVWTVSLVVLAILIIVNIVFTWETWRKLADLGGVLKGCLGLFLLISTIAELAGWVGGSWELLPELAGPIVRMVFGTIFVILMAALLFALKVVRLRIYALLEIAFGVTATGQTTYGLKDVISPIQLLTILTSAYLLIRGLDNFKKDSDARKERKAHARAQESESSSLVVPCCGDFLSNRICPCKTLISFDRTHGVCINAQCSGRCVQSIERATWMSRGSMGPAVAGVRVLSHAVLAQPGGARR